MNYRYDSRTKEQFKKDIKESHVIECDIALRICYESMLKNGYWPVLKPSGSDYRGQWVGKPTIDPDYYIEPDMVEITRAKPKCTTYFHQKVPKVQRAIEVGNAFVFVDGYATENPKYVYLKSRELAFYTSWAEVVHGIRPCPGKNGIVPKDSYRYNVRWFEDMWKPLPEIPLETEFPPFYEEVLEEVGVPVGS